MGFSPPLQVPADAPVIWFSQLGTEVDGKDIVEVKVALVRYIAREGLTPCGESSSLK